MYTVSGIYKWNVAQCAQIALGNNTSIHNELGIKIPVHVEVSMKVVYDEPEIVYHKEVTSQDCETQLHRLMDAYRIKKTREFFDCPLQKIIEFIEML